ncbi:MAG: HEPN domain-containing protein [Bacteroidales bacterium]|jgi:uncharacterized protein (UPF0332 family)|nr:HEPN domain-containing protein [Bacteroidales bacterium]
MSLTDEERITLVELEMEKAVKIFSEIEILVNAGLWSTAANRLYYSVFHAVNALLIKDGHKVQTHQGTHIVFGLYYIKTGIFPAEYGRFYNQLQTLREQSDYNCVYDVAPDELKSKIEPAKEIIGKISEIISKWLHEK